jgi:uncharacterized YigZ family protein
MRIDPYVTVTNETRTQITIKRSTFIGCLIPAPSKTDAIDSLHAIQEEYWDAVHHTFAYRIGPAGLEYRMSDDGEPAGTAGKPLLFTMQRARLSDALIVVVRYFGGIKLGIGPLARAYTDTAQQTIAAATLTTVVPTTKVMVHCTYADADLVLEILQGAGASYVPIYTDVVIFEAQVPTSAYDAVCVEITNRTAGRCGVSKVGAD